MPISPSEPEFPFGQYQVSGVDQDPDYYGCLMMYIHKPADPKYFTVVSASKNIEAVGDELRARLPDGGTQEQILAIVDYARRQTWW